MKITYSGGSSNVFRSALNAPVESICTSSIIYTLYLSSVGAYLTSSFICLILSTPLFEAASISIMLMLLPSSAALHLSHSPHGLPSTGFWQFTALAKILATLVLPVPLVPVKRYA